MYCYCRSPFGVTPAIWRQYVQDEVCANVGGRHPDDPLFHLDRESVLVSAAKPVAKLNRIRTMGDIKVGMFVVHKRTGYIGMIMQHNGYIAAMQAVQNGPWTRARMNLLRAATRQEIKDAGLEGIGCVEPPQ